MSVRRYFTDVSFEQNELQKARLENLDTAPTSPQPGYVYFDTTLLVYRGWDGFQWIELNTAIPQNLLDFDALLDTMSGYPSYALFVNAAGDAIEYVDVPTYLESILPALNDFKVHSASFASQVVVEIQHNMGTENIIYKTYDQSGIEFIPGTFEIVDSNRVRMTNDPPISGNISLLGIL
jgi:hypothetical protein